MNMQPKLRVSVVMPTYNHAQYIGAAIGSVLTQDFRDFELIVVDNHSDDDTKNVVREFDDARIRYVKFRNNGIIGASRNVGMRMAQGKLIAFLDSDDRWYGGKLTRCLAAFEQNPGVIAVCHAENQVRDDVIVGVLAKPSRVGNLYEELLFHRNYLSPSATVVSREEALAIGGFSEQADLVGVEDYDFWIRLAQRGMFSLVPDVLGEFRLHAGNFTANRERLADRVLNMLDRHYSTIPAEKIQARRGQIARRRARVMASCGVRLVQQGQWRGVPWLIRAIRQFTG